MFSLPNRKRAAFYPFVIRASTVFGASALLQFVKWKPAPLERAESLEQLRALENGVKVHVLITPRDRQAIDTPADAKALEQKLARAERRISR